jgi:PAS domain S-box-containing protein
MSADSLQWSLGQPVFDALQEGLVAIDRHGLIKVFNSAAGQLVGVDARHALHRDIRNVIPNTRLPEVVTSGSEELNKLQVLSSKTILTSRFPIRDRQGEVVGAVALFRENTEAVKMAEEITNLRETRALLEAIISSTQDAISVVDAQGKGILINPAYTRLTGLSEDKVLGKPATVDIAEGESVHLSVLKTRQAVKGVSMKVGPKKRPVVVDGAPMLVKGELRGSVAVIHDLTEIHRLAEELEQAQRRIRSLEAKYDFSDIVGRSPGIKEALDQARHAAPTPATVLLRGESGTGKELFAHAIHQASHRNGQFVRVSCAAIADTLLESELFGYVPGAFTGAGRKGRKGYFEMADAGTLFLDEIGEVSLNLQSKLLRVLQEKEIVRVGDSKPRSVDTRVIAATNKDLDQEVMSGAFRQDLYFRLNVVPVTIPPLRERKEDIPLLADMLLFRINLEYGRNIRGLHQETHQVLQRHTWPGNVRELENALRRAVINMSISDRTVLPGHLPPLATSRQVLCDPEHAPGLDPAAWPDKSFARLRQDWERQVLETALARTGGHRARTAELLGISLRNLYNKIRTYNITPPKA